MRALAAVLLLLFASSSFATRYDTPHGELEVRSRGGATSTQIINDVTLRLDEESLEPDFLGVGGFCFAYRLANWRFAVTSIGVPEGGDGNLTFDPELVGYRVICVTQAAPLPVVDGEVLLAEIVTNGLAGPANNWVGPTIQLVPSSLSDAPGWITWRESARTGTCSDTDESTRPCLHRVDGVDQGNPFESDQLTIVGPRIVVRPGERFRTSIFGRFRSALLGYREDEIDDVDVTLTWPADQLALRGNVGGTIEDGVGRLRVERDFDPPLWIDTDTDFRDLVSVEFEVLDGATGAILELGPSTATLSGVNATSQNLHGNVVVMDCTPMDVDDGGQATTADVVRLLQHRARALLLDLPARARDLCAADMNRDGFIRPDDTVHLLRAMVGLPRSAGPNARAVSASLEERAGHVRVSVRGAAGAEVEFRIGTSTLKSVEQIEGRGHFAWQVADERAVLVLASAYDTDFVLDLDVDGPIALASVHASTAAGDLVEVAFDDSPVGSMRESGFLGAFPNPFNPHTTLRYSVERAGPVHVTLHDAMGRRVRAIEATAEAGTNSVAWDGRDDEGRPVASGAYQIRIETRSGVSTGRVLLLK